MLSSPTFALDRFGIPPRSADDRWWTVREQTNGAPCLGVIFLASCGLWAGLGSAVALLLS